MGVNNVPEPEGFRRLSLVLGILGFVLTLAVVGLLSWERYANDLKSLESHRETLTKLHAAATLSVHQMMSREEVGAATTPNVVELGRRVKEKHPGTYDGMSDLEVGRTVERKSIRGTMMTLRIF